MENYIKKARNDKSGKKFWKLVNREKMRREGVDRSIDPREWVKHFTRQLGGSKVEKER